MMLKVTTSGSEKLRAFIKSFGNNMRQKVSGWIAEYIIGDDSHGLKHYPAYKHIPWSSVGGWKSAKQRRYVMARIREGSIEPGLSASQNYLKDAWKFKAAGARYVIDNDVAHGKWLMGPGKQTLHSQRQGWRTTTQVVNSNTAGAIRHARAKVKEWLKMQK
jgi:hypothetical protein